MKVVPGTDFPNHRKHNNPALSPVTMKAYKPVPTVKSAALIFTVLGLIFLIVGSVLLAYSKEIIEHKSRYDNVSPCQNTKYDKIQGCSVTFTLDHTMKSPVYFYYQLNNFYQNHRRYVKSKSAQQLSGSILSESSLQTDCDPIVTMNDLGRSIDDLPSEYLKNNFNHIKN